MQPLAARSLVDSIGVNTHIGNSAIAPVYEDVSNTIAAAKYLGIRLLRDMEGDVGLFRLAAAAIGAKLVLAIGETGPKNYPLELGANLALGSQYLAALEGPNEPDDSYAQGQGGSIEAAAAFQPIIFAAARAIGVAAIANSFGTIWPDPGNYGKTGDLSPWADYGNAHTYFDPHQCGANGNGFFQSGMLDWVQRSARRTVPGKPVAHTEFGWRADHNSAQAIAEYVTTFVVSNHGQWGSPMSIYYGMFDDMAGQWGLFDTNGAPRAAATALRNLIQLMDDQRGSAALRPIDIKITGLPPGENANAGGHAALYQKLNGEYWLALWNDQRLTTPDPPPNKPIVVPTSRCVVTLPTAARGDLFDPLVSLSPTVGFGVFTTFSVVVPTHPVLLRLRF